MIDFDINRIMEYLPHRYPFLLIDRVIACAPGDQLVAVKNVTINEPFFQGHFPGQPIMPGVLVVEALAQATGLLSFCTMEEGRNNKLYLLVGIDKARFRGQVLPGDQLRLTVNLKRNMRGIWMYEGQAEVDGNLVAEVELMCSAQDNKQ